MRDDLAQTGFDAASMRRFAHSVDALSALDSSLTALVSAHNRWQEIDDELRRVETSLAHDLFELELSWPDISAMVQSLCADHTGEWATALVQVGTKLDRALATPTPVRAKMLFLRYRSQASRRFHQVDSDLLALCQDLSEGRFVSLFVAVFDPRQMTLEFQNAGHPAPILFTPESGEMVEIESNAPALGILDEISAGPCPTIPVRKGDWLITYTDGVTEAHDPDRQLFGDERLKALIRRTVGVDSTPKDLMDAVQNELRDWSAGRAQGDDVTLVAARFV